MPDICWTLFVRFHEDDLMFNPRQIERQKIYTNNCEAQSHPSTLVLVKTSEAHYEPQVQSRHNLGFLEVLTHKMVISYIAMTNGI